MNPPPRFNVLGTGVHALSLDEARDRLVAARGQRHLGYVCCATAYNTDLARADAALRRAYNAALLTTPDGMPLVWLGRWHGHRGITRVYGPDLLLATCDAGRAAASGTSSTAARRAWRSSCAPRSPRASPASSSPARSRRPSAS
ncbi:WecB/TagA/CpsF family glycosyltransferase [Oleiharenicola sp. Vm1]|uniref:WecB/TagA/CpsF family glycosyltransferase n=1 Tax=Oleiharenicola sp. Vm1 TaxID=3398393 RepID=UPI0039F564E6